MTTLLQSNLPAKIADINAEKADTTVLDAIPNDKYVSDINDKVLNSKAFLYHTIINIETNPTGAKTAITISMNFEVVFENSNKTDTLKKALRYSRCLREIIQENFKSGKYSNLKVSELIPGNAQLNAGSDFKVGGINIQSTIGG